MDFSGVKKELSVETRISLQLELEKNHQRFCREDERCSVSLSLSSLNGSFDRECGGSDRMVKKELDAAQTLTDLAELALSEAANPSRDENWGNRGRRSRNRLKSEARKRGLKEGMPELEIGISTPEPPTKDPQQHKRVCKYMPRRTIKAHPSELPIPNSMCSTSHKPSHRRKLNQNLSEVEKEAKRLRRVLANRESARQTILRRQAFCEELTRRAADLTLDNETMKREKELVMNEYQFLKDRNEELKIQVAKTIPGENIKDEETKVEVEETSAKAFSTHEETRSSFPTQLPQLVHRPPFTPFVWPPVFPFQAGALMQNITESRDLATMNIANPYQHMGDSGTFRICWPGIPFYMPPCPWFYPPSSHWSGPCTLHPHTSRERDGDENDRQCDKRLLSKETGDAETAASEMKCKNNYSNSTECISKRENAPSKVTEASIKIPTNSGGQILEPYSEDMALRPTPLRTPASSLNVRSENVQELDLESKEAASSKVDSTVCGTENFPGKSIYPSKKLVDAAAAAEARKRRKELTKLKNLHGRQFRFS
ncbi:hypothetical protein AAC387_Pa05g1310 [Persea americana]